LAVFELAARLAHPYAADEHPRLIDHAFALQDVGDIAHAGAARNIHDLVLRQRAGRLEALLAEAERQTGAQRGEKNEREQRAAGDDDGMARARRWTLGLGHPVRLQRRARTARRDASRLYHGCVFRSPRSGRFTFKYGERVKWLEHDPEKWVPVFGKDHAPIVS